MADAGARKPDMVFDGGCIVVQTPDFYGHLRNIKTAADAAHAKGALLIVAVASVVAAWIGWKLHLACD